MLSGSRRAPCHRRFFHLFASLFIYFVTNRHEKKKFFLALLYSGSGWSKWKAKSLSLNLVATTHQTVLGARGPIRRWSWYIEQQWWRCVSLSLLLTYSLKIFFSSFPFLSWTNPLVSIVVLVSRPGFYWPSTVAGLLVPNELAGSNVKWRLFNGPLHRSPCYFGYWAA